jgi:hypothetical protein
MIRVGCVILLCGKLQTVAANFFVFSDLSRARDTKLPFQDPFRALRGYFVVNASVVNVTKSFQWVAPIG